MTRHLRLLVPLAFLWCATAARATVLVPADLGQISREATAIALGRVVGVDGRWAADHHAIETIVTLAVESWLKADLGGTVQFRVPGGTVGRFRTVFVGAPEFAVRDRVIVFLGASGPSIPYVLGLSQGVYRVVVGANGQPAVTPPAFLPVATTTTIVRGDASRRPVALADFEQKVRQLAIGAVR